MKSEPEIRNEIKRLSAQVKSMPHKQHDIEMYSAIMMVQALTWAVGDTKSPSIRIKLR